MRRLLRTAFRNPLTNEPYYETECLTPKPEPQTGSPKTWDTQPEGLLQITEYTVTVFLRDDVAKKPRGQRRRLHWSSNTGSRSSHILTRARRESLTNSIPADSIRK